MTNFERIKAMSIEQLAKMLDGECQFCAYDSANCVCNKEMHCDEGCLKWLRQISREED